MECSVIKKNNEKYTINLSSTIFNVEYNESLLHQLIMFYLSNSHKSIKMQKSRGLVRGGGKKPWRQKGSGRARAGSIRSPLWRGGGKIFAAQNIVKPKKKINKKMYKLGMAVIFSELFRSNRLCIIENIMLDNIKTKDFLNDINHLNINNPSLFILNEFDINVFLSTRNLKNICIIFCKNLNPKILMKFKYIFITVSAIKYIEGYLT